MPTDKKLLVIGLDAGEPSLIEQWIEDGSLPHLGKLFRSGAYRRLSSCTEVSSGATWPSVVTGTNPAKHGKAFYHRQLKTGTYQLVKKYADDSQQPSFWEYLPADVQVCLADIPDTYPAKDFFGSMLVGWGVEGLNWKRCSRPTALFSEVEQRFGAHPLGRWYQQRPTSAAGWQALAEDIVHGTRLRNKIYSWLSQEQSWDLFFAVYAEPHWAGHFFWFLREKNHPDYDSNLAQLCGDVLLKVYQAIDVGIGQLMSQWPDADVMVFSNTGMGPNYSGLHLMPEFFERLGLGNPRKSKKNLKPSAGHSVKSMEDAVGIAAIEWVKQCVPERLWDTLTRSLLDTGKDRHLCQVFEVPSDYSAAVRVNLKGREPKGLVNPGPEYDALLLKIETEVRKLVNAETGEPVVEDIIRVRDKYHGDCADELPDMLIRWKADHYTFALESPSIGRIESVLPDKRSGAHMPQGFLLTSGSSYQRKDELPEADIMDIAPTILTYFGQPIPQVLDGKVLTDI